MKIKITAINRPEGTVTVMWDNDPEQEWNYYVPLNPTTGQPLPLEEMLMYLISHEFHNLEDRKARKKAKFDKLNDLENVEVDVTDLYEEYRLLQEAAQLDDQSPIA